MVLKKENFLGTEMRRLILRVRILVRIKAGKVYSYALMKEFSSGPFSRFMGRNIKNDVYNTIKSLEQSGYIRMSTKQEGGRPKKYYKLTKKGLVVLKSARGIQKEAAKELSKLFD